MYSGYMESSVFIYIYMCVYKMCMQSSSAGGNM